MQAGEEGAGCLDCLLASERCTVVEHVKLGWVRKLVCDGGACER